MAILLPNKKTFLYIKAFELAKDENRDNLIGLFSNEKYPASKIKGVLQFMIN